MRYLVALLVALGVVGAVGLPVGSGPTGGRSPAATAAAAAIPPGELSLAAAGRAFARHNRGYAVRWPSCARPGTYASDDAPSMASFLQSGKPGFVLFESDQRHPSLTAATTHGHPKIRPPVTYGGVTWHIYAYRSNLVILHVFPRHVTVVIEAPGGYAQGLHDAAAFSGLGVCL